jgi:hypothetical protein
MPEVWKPILSEVVTTSGCAGIVHYAVRHGKGPLEFCDDDLDAWGETLLTQGRQYAYVRKVKAAFRRIVFECGLAERLPRISRRKKATYGVPLHSFPP